MQKGLVVANRHRLQLDEIVARAQRALPRIELDLQVIRFRRGDAIGKLDGMGILERLRGFLADVDSQSRAGLVGLGMAVFGIDMQDQDVTPVLRTFERGTDGGKRIIDQGVDVAFQVV